MTTQSVPRRAGSLRSAGKLSRRRWLASILVLVLAAGIIATVWWLRRPGPIDPPMPAHIANPEIHRAIQKARQGVLDKPNSAAAWGQFGMTLVAHAYEAEADRCFAEAARLDSGDVRWPYFRFLCVRKQNPKEAITLLRQATKCTALREFHSAVQFRLAEELLEQRQYDEAEFLFQQELHTPQGQDSPRAAYGLGMIAMARGNAKAAEEYLKIAKNSPVARRPALAQLAALAQARRDATTAAALTSEAAPHLDDEDLWPDPLLDQIAQLQVGPDARLAKVRQFEHRQDYASALQIYLREIEEAPSATAFIGAGLNAARLNDYEQGLRYLQEAVRVEPNNAEAHYILALTQFDRALKAREVAVSSSQARAWFEESIRYARHATQLKPDHARAYLILGLSLRYLELYPTSVWKDILREAALVELRKSVLCGPSDWEIQYYLGDTLLENGELREAEIYLKNARHLAPHEPRVLAALEALPVRGRK